MKVAEYLLGLVVVLVAAYCVVTPIAESTAQSLNNSAELIMEATGK